jgi:hypothetical protein
MDIGKSFTYMFEDPEWLRKLAIGTVVVLIGLVLLVGLIGIIPLLVVAGYSLVVTRNVLDGHQYPLPEWDDWGQLFMRGVKLAVVYLVWSLPLIIVAIPTGIGSSLMNSSHNGTANALGGLFTVCGGCFGFLWGLVLALFSPALYVRLAQTNDIAAGFDFPRLWAFTRNNLANVIIALLVMIVVGLVASIAAFAGIIALVIGLLVTVPFASLWQTLVQAHLFGQVGVAAAQAPASTPSTTI